MKLTDHNATSAPLTQESLDLLDETILEYISQYRSGIMLTDEFLMVMGKLHRTYPNESLVGLIDPATGLKYHPFPTEE